MRIATTIALALLLFALPARASVGATEAREDAIAHYLRIGGDQEDLDLALQAAEDVHCRGHCQVFVVKALTMTLRAEIPPATSQGMVERALFTMADRRDRSPRCWTGIEQGAWMWVQVDGAVQRLLTARDHAS